MTPLRVISPVQRIGSCNRKWLFGFLLVTLSCSPTAPPPPQPPLPTPRPHYVAVNTLCRDVRIARTYEREWIRCELDGGRCEFVNGEIHFKLAANGAPAAILVQFADAISLPKMPPNIVIVGCVSEVRHDGIWRSRNCDFAIAIERARILLD